MHPRISIIICTRNRAESLRHTLLSIAQCDVPRGMDVEGIVVDNGSTDLTADIAATTPTGLIPFRCVCEPRVGKSNAYNAGIAASKGDVLLFTDDDVRVPADWIAGMSRKLLHGEADAVQGGVRVAPHLRRRWLVDGFPCVGASTESLHVEYPDFLIGANMALSRRVLERVQSFDPELGPGALGFGEETLYARQLIRAGYTIRAELSVVVEHHFDESRLAPEAIAETHRKMGRCKAYLAYHWEHSGLWAFDWYGCVRKTLAYSWRELSRRAVAKGEMPPGGWRMPAVEAAAFLSQYARERRRERRYPQYGLAFFPHGRGHG